MKTLSFKRTISLLTGLLLVLSLFCISAAGQHKSKGQHRKAARAMVPVTGPYPTALNEYTCGSDERVLMRFDFTRNMPGGGFLGNEYTSYLSRDGRVLRTTTKAVQWFAPSPPPTQQPQQITWQYQAQDGSFVCKAVVVGPNGVSVDFATCTNLPVRSCGQ
jgi:hypothetical protein